MLTTGMQNLPEPLASAPVAYHDVATESPRLVTQAGFGLEFLDYFAVVEDVHSACGRSARAERSARLAGLRSRP